MTNFFIVLSGLLYGAVMFLLFYVGFKKIMNNYKKKALRSKFKLIKGDRYGTED